MTMTILFSGLFFFFHFNSKTLGKNKIFSLFSPIKSVSVLNFNGPAAFYSAVLLNTISESLFQWTRQDFQTGRSSFWWFVFPLFIHLSLFYCFEFECVATGVFVDISFNSWITIFEQGSLGCRMRTKVRAKPIEWDRLCDLVATHLD